MDLDDDFEYYATQASGAGAGTCDPCGAEAGEFDLTDCDSCGAGPLCVDCAESHDCLASS